MTWIEETKFTASNGVLWDPFGYYVSISGDYAVIGAIAYGRNKMGMLLHQQLLFMPI